MTPYGATWTHMGPHGSSLFYRFYVGSECGLRSNCSCKTGLPCFYDLSKCIQLRQSCSKSRSRLVRPSLINDNFSFNTFFLCFIYFHFSILFMFLYFSVQMYHSALLFSLFSHPTSTQKKNLSLDPFGLRY